MKVNLWPAILLCAALPAMAAQRAAPQVCAPYTNAITLDFKTLMPPPLYNTRLNVQGIRNLFREHTDAQTLFALQGATTVKPVRGGYCIYITRIEAEFGWKRMDVYVANDFKRDTCEYRAILDHENQHVGINNAALKEFAPRMRLALEKILADQQPVFSPDGQAGTDAALEAVQDRMVGYLDQFQSLTAQRNAPLDSQNNYGETAKLCSNWDGEAPPAGRR
ncbi:MAG: hypothetical protein K2P94_07980 [Rhodospirillaceae bacterium]|nr:hypothetical protein [Rhodospirillaceae bacterium]